MAYDALQSLQLDSQLTLLSLNRAEMVAAIGSIIGRMVAPGSELSTHRWLQQEIGLGELIDHLVVSRKCHVEWDEELSQIVRAQGTN